LKYVYKIDLKGIKPLEQLSAKELKELINSASCGEEFYFCPKTIFAFKRDVLAESYYDASGYTGYTEVVSGEEVPIIDCISKSMDGYSVPIIKNWRDAEPFGTFSTFRAHAINDSAESLEDLEEYMRTQDQASMMYDLRCLYQLCKYNLDILKNFKTNKELVEETTQRLTRKYKQLRD